MVVTLTKKDGYTTINPAESDFFNALAYATSSEGNRILIIQQCYGCAIAEGYITGHTIWRKIGYLAASTTSEVTMWNPGTAYVFPTGEMGMEVVSTDNTNDKAGGTGALTVKITYLNAAGTQKEETVTLTGTTAAPTTATDIYRVNAFRVATTGSTGKSAGVISLRHLNDTPIYSQIAAGYRRARNSVYTVPAGKTLFIKSLCFSAGATAAGKTVRVTLHASYDELHDTALVAGKEFDSMHETVLMDNSVQASLDMPIKIPEMTDIKVSVIGEAGAQVTSMLEGWIE